MRDLGVADFRQPESLIQLFQVLPKNLVLMRSTMPTANVVANMKLAIETCGHRGAMQLSGAHVIFETS